MMPKEAPSTNEPPSCHFRHLVIRKFVRHDCLAGPIQLAPGGSDAVSLERGGDAFVANLPSVNHSVRVKTRRGRRVHWLATRRRRHLGRRPTASFRLSAINAAEFRIGPAPAEPARIIVRRLCHQPILDCGGKRSATPLWDTTDRQDNGIAAAPRTAVQIFSTEHEIAQLSPHPPV